MGAEFVRRFPLNFQQNEDLIEKVKALRSALGLTTTPVTTFAPPGENVAEAVPARRRPEDTRALESPSSTGASNVSLFLAIFLLLALVVGLIWRRFSASRNKRLRSILLRDCDLVEIRIDPNTDTA